MQPTPIGGLVGPTGGAVLQFEQNGLAGVLVRSIWIGCHFWRRCLWSVCLPLIKPQFPVALGMIGHFELSVVRLPAGTRSCGKHTGLGLAADV